MKKGKVKSLNKTKCLEKKKNSKSTVMMNVNNLNNNYYESLKIKQKLYLNQDQRSSNSNQKAKIQKIINKQNNPSLENDQNKLSRKAIYENQLLLNNINPSLQNENISNNNSDAFNNEKILLKLKRIQEQYENKISKDDKEIKVLLERNDKLEELVLKLKETLDRANEMFPDFLEQLVNSKEERERETNRTNISNMERRIEEQISIMKTRLKEYEVENSQLRNENTNLKNEFNSKIESIIQEIENKQSKKDEIYNSKINEFNSEIDINKKQINKLQSDNQQHIFQITTLTEEIQQKDEEIKILKNKINNNEEKKNDLIINDLKAELEEMIVENNDLKNNLTQASQDLEKEKKNRIKVHEDNKNLSLLIEGMNKESENKLILERKKYEQQEKDFSIKINIIQNELKEKNEKLINAENSQKIIESELNNKILIINRLKEEYESKNNKNLEEINILQEKINNEFNMKNEENKRMNEIIKDQEKVITDLKDIIHKNKDKIIELTKINEL